MSSCRDALLAWALLGAAAAAGGSEPYPGIGRSATASELAAWDRDVRPDFKGLPAGRGSVAEGQVLWEARCAACHGIFGESNEWTQPLSGGTDAEDIRRGRVARLADPTYPQRSSLMKLATLSTLWDAIARSMPWDAPGTLSADQTYAATAYLLHQAGIVDEAFVLDRASAAAVQQRLPNRHGMQFEHAMWPGGLPGSTRRPDTRGDTCRRACPPPQRVVGFPPGHARDSHGELSEQNRLVGAQRGAPTPGAAR